MFIAMNRFRMKRGSEEAFEQVWLSRDTQLTKVPGFVEFHLLKGREHEDYTLYSSHTVWQSKATFEAWTKSEAFRLAHRDAGQTFTLYLLPVSRRTRTIPLPDMSGPRLLRCTGLTCYT
jgi:heme-degrading monooxygenase HmoA